MSLACGKRMRMVCALPSVEALSTTNISAGIPTSAFSSDSRHFVVMAQVLYVTTIAEIRGRGASVEVAASKPMTVDESSHARATADAPGLRGAADAVVNHHRHA